MEEKIKECKGIGCE